MNTRIKTVDIKHEVISNKQTSTPPLDRGKEGIKGFSLDVFERACEARGVSMEDAIAKFLALTKDDAAESKANPINLLRDQAKMVLEVANKYVPNLSATTVEGEVDVRVTKVERHIVDPRNSDS